VSARIRVRSELIAAEIEDAVRRLEDAVRKALLGTRRSLIVIEPGRPDAVPRAA
jgi:hypothetical protein